MIKTLPARFHQSKRHKLAKEAGVDMIVVAANGLLQRNADMTYPFRQDSNFWYLTGLETPGAVLVIDAVRNEEYIILAGRSSYLDTFEGEITAGDVQKTAGIERVYNEVDGWQEFEKRSKGKQSLGVIDPPKVFIDVYGMHTNPQRRLVRNEAQRRAGRAKVVSINDWFAENRAVKDDDEIALIQEAIDITALGFEAVPSIISACTHEFEIEAELSKAFRANGADGHAYEPIVASGVQACTLHYTKNNRAINTGDLVLVDAGAQVSNYSADITRMFAKRSFTARQNEIYVAVREVQEYALSLLRPGVLLRNYEEEIERALGEKLNQLGLISDMEKASIRKFYPHSSSHFLGLDTHDVGQYKQPLKAGMVLTVEPGIYCRDEQIGIRIEDDVLINENGIKNLSQNIPKQ